MTNNLRVWTLTTRWILRTSLTPDCFVSRKVRLLKIIKIDSVINITTAYTKIFPRTDTKKRHFLPTKDRYSSVRCVILKDKARCLKILRKTLLEFVFLGWRFQYKRDYNILLFQNTTNHFFKLQDCIQSAKIGKGPSIMEKYPILQICRTERFKIDWYIPKPETFCKLSGERQLCIITTYFIWETSRFFIVSFHSSLWSWRVIFESWHWGRAGFWGQAGLLTALYLERLGC